MTALLPYNDRTLTVQEVCNDRTIAALYQRGMYAMASQQPGYDRIMTAQEPEHDRTVTAQ